ncbi:unnamed protein product [Trifolium pratense]|uniref:Uncharacterized protein n=1 Tax=Trifolium pratense TaxID=57577 RepID=A0ACB0IYB3_TRIPR|nr:unnamed protein product [Trifolium pratense]
MKALLALRDGFEFRLGNGNSSFWFSNWSGTGKLADKVLYVDIHDLEMSVKDVYTDGNWNFNMLYTNIPTAVTDHLKMIPVCLNSQVADCYTWKGNLNGIYSARDGYFWLNRNEFAGNDTDSISWTWLWNISAPEKLKFFLWTALHNSLPTREMLCHRNMLQANHCPRCNQEIETTLHCLRDCDFAVRLWHSIGFTDQAFYRENDLYNWLRIGIQGKSVFMFLAAVWWLWRARNLLCLANELVSLITLRMWTENYAHLLFRCFFKQATVPDTKWVRWNAHRGSGFSNILHAELLAIYYGLVMAWEFGITDLWCYSDSKVAIKLISESVNAWHHYAAILYNIKEYLARDWRIHIVHTFREGNACADYLAKFGAANPEAYSPIVDPPIGMNLLLLADACGTFFSR